MIKVEVIEKFTLKDFDELQNVERKSVDTKGSLYVGDTFECSEAMAKYLMGDNALKKVVVKILEVKPKEEITPIEYKAKVLAEKEEQKEIKKPKKKKSKK